MKKLLLIIAVLVGLGCFAAPKAEAYIGIRIGVPVVPVAPAPVYYGYGPYYGPYYAGYYGRPFGYWRGGYWHGHYWRSGYYARHGYYAHRYRR